jgi:hypothetical protein
MLGFHARDNLRHSRRLHLFDLSQLANAVGPSVDEDPEHGRLSKRQRKFGRMASNQMV